MSAPENEYQQALYTAIAAAVAPVAVEVHPPHDKPLPYVQLGNSESSDAPDGRTLEMIVNTWSSKEGAHEVQALMQQVRDAVVEHAFTVTEWRFYCIRDAYSTVFLDEDDEAWHGVQRITALAEPIP